MRRLELIIAVVVVVLDQWTKALVRGRLELHESVDVVAGWLSLTRVHNTGAAFGMLNGVDFPFKTLVLMIVAGTALAGVAWYAASLPADQKLARLGLAGVLGGAIGNLIDRATAGYVLDFVDAYWGTWHFWAFNIADAAISVGVVFLLLDVVLDVLDIDVHPILLEAGPVTIYTYGVLLAAAYLLGLWMAVRRATAAGFDGNRVLDLGIWVIIAALVGAKGLLFIVDFEHFTSSREEFFSLLRSGGVFYGGLIAASLTCIYQLRKHKLPLWTSGDLFAPGIALGYMVGRLGCFAAGCCYGKPTQVAWAVTFTDPAAALNVGTPLNVPLHPTQLYESLAGLVILVAVLTLERRGKPYPGRTFWQFVLIYGVSRFIIEFFRGDDRGAVAMFSTSQLISLVLVPLSVVMLAWLARRAAAPASRQARSVRR